MKKKKKKEKKKGKKKQGSRKRAFLEPQSWRKARALHA